jgi:hypothetical protein
MLWNILDHSKVTCELTNTWNDLDYSRETYVNDEFLMFLGRGHVIKSGGHVTWHDCDSITGRQGEW